MEIPECSEPAKRKSLRQQPPKVTVKATLSCRESKLAKKIWTRRNMPKRTWTQEEKSALCEALHKYGEDKIARIATCIPTKSQEQIREIILDFKTRAEDITHSRQIVTLDKWLKILRKLEKPEHHPMDDPLAQAFLVTCLLEKTPPAHECDGLDIKEVNSFVLSMMANDHSKPVSKKSLEFIRDVFKEIELTWSNNTETIQSYFDDETEVEDWEFSNNKRMNPLNFPRMECSLTNNDDNDDKHHNNT